jgi:hypothetical protein
VTEAPTSVQPDAARSSDPLRAGRRLAAMLTVAGLAVVVAGLLLGWWSVGGRTVANTDWGALGFVEQTRLGTEGDPPGTAEAVNSNGLASAFLALLVLLVGLWPRRRWARGLTGTVSGIAGFLLMLMTTTAGRRQGVGHGEYNRALVVTAVVWGLVMLVGSVLAGRRSRTARAGLLTAAAALTVVNVLVAVLTTRAALDDAGHAASLTLTPWLAVAGALLIGAGAVLLGRADHQESVATRAVDGGTAPAAGADLPAATGASWGLGAAPSPAGSPAPPLPAGPDVAPTPPDPGASPRALVVVSLLVAGAVLVPYAINFGNDRIDPGRRAAQAVQDYADAINSRAEYRALPLLCAAVKDDYPSAQIGLALAMLDHPPYSSIEVGTPTAVTVGGREGFSVPLSLTVAVTDPPTEVEQDVFVVDEYGWKLCSPQLAGGLGETP